MRLMESKFLCYRILLTVLIVVSVFLILGCTQNQSSNDETIEELSNLSDEDFVKVFEEGEETTAGAAISGTPIILLELKKLRLKSLFIMSCNETEDKIIFQFGPQKRILNKKECDETGKFEITRVCGEETISLRTTLPTIETTRKECTHWLGCLEEQGRCAKNCEEYSSSEVCGSQPYCHWDQRVNVCFQINENTPCGLLTEHGAYYCDLRGVGRDNECAWNSRSNSCNSVQQGSDCPSYVGYGRDVCERQGRCVWARNTLTGQDLCIDERDRYLNESHIRRQ